MVVGDLVRKRRVCSIAAGYEDTSQGLECDRECTIGGRASALVLICVVVTYLDLSTRRLSQYPTGLFVHAK